MANEPVPAPEPSSTPGAFDPQAFKNEFKAELMGEIRKDLNGITKSLKTDLAKMFQKPNDPPADPNPDSSPDPQADPGKPPKDPALAAEVRALKRQNEDLQKMFGAIKADADQTKAAAEEKERHANIQSHLSSKFKFYDQAAFNDALTIFRSQIKRNEDGALVGPEGTPMEQYIEESMQAKQYLLAPKDAGAAGARPGNGRGGARSFTLDDLDSEKFQAMKPEEKAALRQQVSNAAQAALTGKG